MSNIEIINGVEFEVVEIKTEKQTAVVKTRIPTPEEQAEQEYQSEKSKALKELNEIKDLIVLGLKTEEDFKARQLQWLEYHNQHKGGIKCHLKKVKVKRRYKAI